MGTPHSMGTGTDVTTYLWGQEWGTPGSHEDRDGGHHAPAGTGTGTPHSLGKGGPQVPLGQGWGPQHSVGPRMEDTTRSIGTGMRTPHSYRDWDGDTTFYGAEDGGHHTPTGTGMGTPNSTGTWMGTPYLMGTGMGDTTFHRDREGDTMGTGMGTPHSYGANDGDTTFLWGHHISWGQGWRTPHVPQGQGWGHHTPIGTPYLMGTPNSTGMGTSWGQGWGPHFSWGQGWGHHTPMGTRMGPPYLMGDRDGDTTVL